MPLMLALLGVGLLVTPFLRELLGSVGELGVSDWLATGDAKSQLDGLAQSLGSSLVVACAFWFLIDRQFDRMQEAERERRELDLVLNFAIERLRQGGEAANSAISELRSRGLLYDNSLSGANFSAIRAIGVDLDNSAMRNSDLSSADFTRASLCGADLSHSRLLHADFSEADMSFANLTGATYDDESLAAASSLWGAKMSGGELYDGRFNLPLDERRAREMGYDLKDPTQKSAFFLSAEPE